MDDLDKKLENQIHYIYDEKYLFIDSPRIIIDVQNKLYNMLIDYFEKMTSFNKRLNTSGLYIAECLDYKIITTFYATKDQSYIKEVDDLIINTIDKIYSLCVFLLDDSKDKRYFDTHLEYLNNCLKLRLYSITENQLYNEKVNVIKINNEKLIDTEIKLLYRTLYAIDTNNVNNDYFRSVLKLWNVPQIKTAYYNYKFDPELNFLNYNSLKGGVQTISSFNYNKYRLLISFYNYVETGVVDIAKFDKENFTSYAGSNFENEINNLSIEFIKQYFDFDNTKLNEFKISAKNEVNVKIKAIENAKGDHIKNSKLKAEYKQQFKQNCVTAWHLGQNKLRTFLYFKSVNLESKKEIFGIYTLYDKDWFIEPYDKNIGYAREYLGQEFGEDQYYSKLKYILNKIGTETSLYNKTLDKKVNITVLSENVVKNEEYYLFYNTKIFDEVKYFPNIEWVGRSKDDDTIGKIKINNSIIYLWPFQSDYNLLIPKHEFILQQSEKGFENEIEELFVDVLELEPKDKIDLNKDKDGKDKKTFDDKVKIRIAEKFEIERHNKKGFIKIIVDEKDDDKKELT